MKVLYSFIVDGAPKFLTQARVFLHTLIVSGVEPRDIIAQITPAAGDAGHDIARTFGAQSVGLNPILDGRYCNKIAQLDALCEMNADSVVLCDTDLAFLEPLTPVIKPGLVMAKVVDCPNPPLEKLNQLAALAGVKPGQPLVNTSCADGLTWASNCNGGVYVIPHALLGKLKPLWKEYAARTLACGDLLERWIIHADQLGFALAMAAFDESVEPLPIEYNFPMHLTDAFDRMSFGMPKVLHYHNFQEKDGTIRRTGNRLVDEAVNQINSRISTAAALGRGLRRPFTWRRAFDKICRL